ncbi:MAG: hypothetical protein WCJ76_05735 [Comamonadaceae bacterium]
MTERKIDLTTLTMGELKRLHADAAAIIAAEEATKLKVAAFCDEVYALAKQRGVTMADLVRGLSIVETVKEGQVARSKPVAAKHRKSARNR